MSADPLPERRVCERPSKSVPRRDLLFIVSRDALDHYEHLKRVFADDKKVTVILDRRTNHWNTSSAPEAERLPVDRRARPLIDDRLRRQGWAIVQMLYADSRRRD